MTSSRRNLLVFPVLCILVLLGSCSTAEKPKTATGQKIIVLYPGPLGLYEDIIAGFKERLAKELPGKSVEVIPRHANNDKTQFASLVSSAVNDHPDIIAPIGTRLSQESVKNARVPVVFLGVTDPAGDGVVRSLAAPETSTGVSDLVPLAQLLTLIQQVTPLVKKIGVPYTPEDPPARFSVRELQKLGPERGYTIDARPVTSQDELSSVVRELARVNDAILVGADTGLFPAADQIAKIAMLARKPFFAGDPDGVKAGAALGVTIDYHDVGRAGAPLAARVLKGEKAGAIPITLLTNGEVIVNDTSLNKLGIRLNDDVRKQVKGTYH